MTIKANGVFPSVAVLFGTLIGLGFPLSLSGCGRSDDKGAGKSAPVVKDLKWCAENGDLEGLKAFLTPGNIDGTDDQKPPLHLAAIGGYPEITEYLLGQGADINKTDSSLGWTPIHYAVNSGHAGVVAMLISKGARIDNSDGRGNYPIHTAASQGHVDVIKVLLEAGAKPDQESGAPYGDTQRMSIASEVSGFGGASDRYQPIHSAAAGNQPEAVRFFIGLGISPEATDGRGNSVLHYATYKWGWCDRTAETIRLVDRDGAFELAAKDGVSTKGYYTAEVLDPQQGRKVPVFIRFMPEELVTYEGMSEKFPTQRAVISIGARGGTRPEEIAKWLTPKNEEAEKQGSFITGRYKLMDSSVLFETFNKNFEITFSRSEDQLKFVIKTTQGVYYTNNGGVGFPDVSCSFERWK